MAYVTVFGITRGDPDHRDPDGDPPREGMGEGGWWSWISMAPGWAGVELGPLTGGGGRFFMPILRNGNVALSN